MTKFNRRLDLQHSRTIDRAATRWGRRAISETDEDMAIAYAEDAAALRRVAAHLRAGHRASAANLTDALDILVRDLIPSSAHAYLYSVDEGR